MVETLATRLRGLMLLAWLTIPSATFAHRLDEYLQATLVDIEAESVRLQINLMPGVAVAQEVLAQIDLDGNGVISPEEATNYAKVLQSDLTVQLDQQNVELKLNNSDFPTVAELRNGVGIIALEFTAKPAAVARGAHTLGLVNRHLPTVSVYLINAAKPKSDLIQIATQQRNQNQSTGEIKFILNELPNAP